MIAHTRFRLVLSTLALYAAAGGLITYFGTNAYSGQRGIIAKAQVEADLAQLQGQLQDLRAQKALLTRHVALLRSDSIDPDMLDQRARDLLNYTHPNDLVMFDKR